MTTESAIDLEHPCPYVGTGFDRTVHFGYPTHENVCFATGRGAGIENGHQGVYCLTPQHAQCPRYLQAIGSPSAPVIAEAEAPGKRVPAGMLRYALLGIAVVLLAVALVWLWPQIRPSATPLVAATAVRATATPTSTQATEPTATPFVLQAVKSTPGPTSLNTPTIPPTSTATPTAIAATAATPTTTVAATATSAPTATPTRPNTPTVRPTATSTVRPTSTPTVRPTDTPTRQPTATPVGVDAAPILRAPANNTDASGLVTFSWDWPGSPLAPNQGFEVRIWRADQPDHYGAAAPVRTNSATIDLAGAYGVQQGGSGLYLWTVAVVGLNPYQRIGPEAAARQLKIELAGGGPTPAPTLPP
ncbi:hypothetical protein [Candidatus Amarolinea aalborgensis]|uniref:hypothetical protein n=1 Tax=Candidatus Amarolinea aalborgensis TaxID=2249329 RepID=UPI003BFA0891